MNDFDRDEARLVRLLGAVRAPADPGVMARVRTRLAGEPDVPHLFAWLGTPAALVVACLLVLTAAGMSLNLLDAENVPVTRDASMVSALIGDDGSDGLPSAAAAGIGTTDGGVVDSQRVVR